jgi:hypothetical protein
MSPRSYAKRLTAERTDGARNSVGAMSAQVDHQFKLADLLHWQILRSGAPQNAIDVARAIGPNFPVIETI